jgi:hypothetical protein
VAWGWSYALLTGGMWGELDTVNFREFPFFPRTPVNKREKSKGRASSQG